MRGILTESRVAAQIKGFRKEAGLSPGAELLVMNRLLVHELPKLYEKVMSERLPKAIFEQKKCEFSAKFLRGELKWILAKLMQYWRFLNPRTFFGCGIAQKSDE
jgi:hypothetical protein